MFSCFVSAYRSDSYFHGKDGVMADTICQSQELPSGIYNGETR